ncbi:MAG TPA: M24 family metallopeptidase [Verrucomicrobiae bacterium]|nr:M24 family metallopeptidase [Verrucomicrobiae bacterium]
MYTEFGLKLARVRGLLKSTGAEAALIGRQSNFSWLACGGDSHVALNSDRAAGQLLVTPKKVFLLTNRIEMSRMQDEVARGLGVEPLMYEWHDDQGASRALKKVLDLKQVISDTGNFGTRAAPELFAPLRYSLLPVEVKRFQALGRHAEGAMELTCGAIQPGLTEYMIAGHLAEECWCVGVTPLVLLIATDERIHKYRHPLPTRKKLKRHAMLVLCARQHGLVVSLTRLVHFGKTPAELRRRHAAACAVDAAFISNTRVGLPIREIFQRGTAAYAEQGFPNEWQLHHQGGPCGYETRDVVATPATPGTVVENQGFAWNPSITGTKSEDTILATAKGPKIITESTEWPRIRVECGKQVISRPDILVR